MANQLPSACNAGDLGLIPEFGRSPGEGNGNPLQQSCLGSATDRGAWQAIVYGGRKSRTQLSDSTTTNANAAGPGTILCVEELVGGYSKNWTSQMAQQVNNPPAVQGTQVTRVRSLGQEDPLEEGMATTPVFLPEEYAGQRGLAGYSPWGCKELDTTEHPHTLFVGDFTI